MSISVEVQNAIDGAKKSQIKRLFLNYQQLKELPQELLELDKVEKIFLKYNSLVQLPSQIYKLKSLVELYLHSNNLQTLPEGIGQLYSLKSLNISSNLLRSLPSTVGDLAKLEDLHLAYNKLTEIPESLGKLKCLRNLDIMNNDITILPWQLCFCEKLETLLADGNRIQQIPRQLTCLKQLKELSLSRNNLLTIPQDIDNMLSLENLLLDSNVSMCALPATVFRLENLTTLGINRCGKQDQNDTSDLDMSVCYQDVRFTGNQIDRVCPMLELSLRKVYKHLNSDFNPNECLIPSSLSALLLSPSGHCYYCRQPFFTALFRLTTNVKKAVKITRNPVFEDLDTRLPIIFAVCSLNCLNNILSQ